MTAPINNYTQVEADEGEKYGVGEDPEPLGDVQRRKKRGQTGCEVKVRKGIVNELRQPDPARREAAALTATRPRIRSSCRFPCGRAQHRHDWIPCQYGKPNRGRK